MWNLFSGGTNKIKVVRWSKQEIVRLFSIVLHIYLAQFHPPNKKRERYSLKIELSKAQKKKKESAAHPNHCFYEI
ncbi:hypothetical protein K1719_025219 [Acacia pycnantha]|nr:hypothetical protein K1719_025219 [Acacia pycnantha]